MEPSRVGKQSSGDFGGFGDCEILSPNGRRSFFCSKIDTVHARGLTLIVKFRRRKSCIIPLNFRAFLETNRVKLHA